MAPTSPIFSLVRASLGRIHRALRCFCSGESILCQTAGWIYNCLRRTARKLRTTLQNCFPDPVPCPVVPRLPEEGPLCKRLWESCSPCRRRRRTWCLANFSKCCRETYRRRCCIRAERRRRAVHTAIAVHRRLPARSDYNNHLLFRALRFHRPKCSVQHTALRVARCLTCPWHRLRLGSCTRPCGGCGVPTNAYYVLENGHNCTFSPEHWACPNADSSVEDRRAGSMPQGRRDRFARKQYRDGKWTVQQLINYSKMQYLSDKKKFWKENNMW